MTVDGADQLEEKSWNGPLAPADVRRLGKLLTQSQNSGEQITLISTAGRGHARVLRLQVERFLSPEYDPMVFAAALATLTAWWALHREYREIMLAAVRGYPWDIDQDVRLRGLGVWSRDEVTGVKLEDVGCAGPGMADGFERRLPSERLEVFGKVVG